MNEMYVNLKKGENIGRNKGQVWKGRKDEGMKRKKFARSRIIDHGFVLCSVFQAVNDTDTFDVTIK